MAKQRGKNVLLYLATGGSPQVYTKLAGQTDTQLSITADGIDVMDKDTDNWMARLTGAKDLKVACSGNANWPDTDGIQALIDAHEADDTIDAKLVLNEAGIYYEAAFVISSLEIRGPHNGVTGYSVSLDLAVTPYHTP